MTTVSIPDVVPFGSGQADAIEAAASWMTGLVTGSLAIALCTLAIGFAGLLLLSGHLHLRAGLRAVLGCFVLLGAPIIAGALLDLGEEASENGVVTQITSQSGERVPLPDSAYDPYAGASLKQE